MTHNWRVRLKVFCPDDELPMVGSLTDVWSSANWFEREAFDLYGIIFEGHLDLRRILTDYGFIGHPFRKDFPVIGHVEMRYDPEQQARHLPAGDDRAARDHAARHPRRKLRRAALMNWCPRAHMRSLPPEGAQASKGPEGAPWPMAARRES